MNGGAELVDQPTPGDIPSGFLSDARIRALVEAGQLFYQNSLPSDWREESVRHASYQLRLSSTYRIADYSQPEIVEWRERTATDDAPIQIPPGGAVQLLSEEAFRVPSDVSCRINPVGRLFLMGVCVEVTYADPGYEGEMHLVAFNMGPREVRLHPGIGLARVEFVKLPDQVSRPHNTSKNTSPTGTLGEHEAGALDTSKRSELVEMLRKFANDERYDKRHEAVGALVTEYETRGRRLNQAILMALLSLAIAGAAVVLALSDDPSGQTRTWLLASLPVVSVVVLTWFRKQLREAALGVLTDITRKGDSR